jgi:hypothetical protein
VITIGKTVVLSESGKAARIFTMTLDGETIDLLPSRNWSQQDVYKWRARGKLPGNLAGLEITPDHVKLAGETVLTNDPEGAAKLQRLLNEWLALELGAFELAQKRAQQKPTFFDQQVMKPATPPRPPPEVKRPGGRIRIVIPTPGCRGGHAARAAQPTRHLPNAWLQPVLARRPIAHDWFASLAYTRMAEHFGNSSEGYFGPIPCWACSLGEVADISDPGFKGIFLTRKGGLGYFSRGHLARFRNEVAFIGTLESTIEGIGIDLVATGTDSQQRIAFIVTEGYRTKFGISEQTVVQELAGLKTYGALVMSVSEVLHSFDALDVVWTVPAEQEDPSNPQAVESANPNRRGGIQGIDAHEG